MKEVKAIVKSQPLTVETISEPQNLSISKQPVDDEEQGNNTSTWFIC